MINKSNNKRKFKTHAFNYFNVNNHQDQERLYIYLLVVGVGWMYNVRI